jgi:dTDP-4-dehydrorhamnose reductase
MEKVKKKVLVLGSSGMMGHLLVGYLTQNTSFQVYNISRKDKINSETIVCDVLDLKKIESIIFDIDPDYIINAIGILVKESETNIINAILINSLFPHKLKNIADNINANLIHLSTDCVFDGLTGNYNENSMKTPIDIYGKTKDLGEIINENHLTIRTSIIGPEIKDNGTGLFLWLLKMKNQEINGFQKSIWSGLTTLELSKALVYSIKNNIKGLIHIHNNPINKYDLLCLINTEFNLNIKINKIDGIISDKSLTSIRDDFSYKVCPYKVMIHDLRLYIDSNNYVH